MFPLSSDILTLTDEPAVLAQGGRLVFANKAAARLLGDDCLGKSVAQCFGEELSGYQAGSFVADIPVSGQRRMVRVSRLDGMQVIFLSREDKDPSVLNAASLAAMRESLMGIGLAAGRGRELAEELALPQLDACFAGMTEHYFRLRRLLNNTSALYASLRHELPVAFSSLDLTEVCRQILDSLSLLRPDVRFRLDAPESLLLWADVDLIELALMNLLSNSLRHAAGLSRISLSLLETKQSVVLAVSDDGCGIAPEQLPAVFDRFRLDFALKDMSLGAGLGMSVVRSVARSHGGALLLESREGQGTTVRISFSRSLNNGYRLHAPRASYQGSMETLLTGLAGCLPSECYTAKYLD